MPLVVGYRLARHVYPPSPTNARISTTLVPFGPAVGFDNGLSLGRSVPTVDKKQMELFVASYLL